MSALQVLVIGELWRTPVPRQSKAGTAYATALIKGGTPTEPLWANIVAFDQAAQTELLRLAAGESVCIQGVGKLGTFEKNGEHRASLDVTANHVLALRQKKPKRDTAPARDDRRAPPTDLPFDDRVPF